MFLLSITGWKCRGCSNPRHVVPVITYAEMRFGAIDKKASPRYAKLVDAFCARLDAIRPRDRAAMDATQEVELRLFRKSVSPNDTAIPGYTIVAGAVLLTNNMREFGQVPGMLLSDVIIREYTRHHTGLLLCFDNK
ncbi:hypothetical protein SG79_15865 [Enterobacter hormaechei subsp. xiangfangensis]|nr:hypothetical protein SG79_15865 [Enterobacter hormaechei subsp. xiangfangensis]